MISSIVNLAGPSHRKFIAKIILFIQGSMARDYVYNKWHIIYYYQSGVERTGKEAFPKEMFNGYFKTDGRVRTDIIVHRSKQSIVEH